MHQLTSLLPDSLEWSNWNEKGGINCGLESGDRQFLPGLKAAFLPFRCLCLLFSRFCRFLN